MEWMSHSPVNRCVVKQKHVTKIVLDSPMVCGEVKRLVRLKKEFEETEEQEDRPNCMSLFHLQNE